MAFFGCSIETLERVDIHPNADALDLGFLQGMSFQFVLAKDKFKLGDKVVYFPIDSILPADVAEVCGVLNKLSGSAKNRLKTIRLRGEISQGLVVSLEKIDQIFEQRANKSLSVDLGLKPPTSERATNEERESWDWKREGMSATVGVNSLGDEIDTNELTARLNVIKYEPQQSISIQQGARVSTLPTHLSKYDIEDATRYLSKLSHHFDDGFVATLKLEGCNFCVGYAAHSDDVYVCSRKQHISVDDSLPEESLHFFLKYSKSQQLEDRVRRWARERFPDQTVTLYGEMLGPNIQKNLYRLKEHIVVFFDIKVGHRWLDYLEFKSACIDDLKLHTVPEIIAPNEDKGRSLSSLLESTSLSDLSRVSEPVYTTTAHPDDALQLKMHSKIPCHEGLVFRPLIERRDPHFGRVILKKRNPYYLEKSGL